MTTNSFDTLPTESIFLPESRQVGSCSVQGPSIQVIMAQAPDREGKSFQMVEPTAIQSSRLSLNPLSYQ